MMVRLALFLTATLVTAAGSAADATAPPAARAGQPAVTATVPLIYDSVRETYRPYRADEPATDWRAANAAVGSLGGHGGQLAAPLSPQSAAPSSPEATR